MINHAMKRIRALEDRIEDLVARLDRIEQQSGAAARPAAPDGSETAAKPKQSKARRRKARVLPKG